VSPGRAYMVGERGPEMFVPTSAGAVTPNEAMSGGAREVRVSINVNAPAGGDQAQALQRSSRQVASAVRRALSGF
jgi:phage-related minor tail protein